MSKAKSEPLVRLSDVLRLIESAKVPLAGFDRPELADRSHFAAFNMGRFHQYLLMELAKLKAVKKS